MDTKKISPFQIGIFVLCGIGIVFGFLIFSGKIPVGQNSAQTVKGTVTVWGTVPYLNMIALSDEVRKTYKDVTISYVEKTPATFQTELVEALASGVGPDIVILDTGTLIANLDRITPFPYTALPEATFKNTFIDQSSLFAYPVGIFALPFVVDPMVMYYNRDILSSAFVVNPPKTWEEVVALNAKVTQKDDAGTLLTETVALGTFDNILHAKELMILLIRQAGGNLTTWSTQDNKFVSGLSQTPAARNALDFYTQFSNPNNETHYSWNPTLPQDRNQFIFGKLALYFGYASEVTLLRTKNPNLNFSVALVPQREKSSVKSVYGKMMGIAVMKSSRQSSLAFTIAQSMVKTEALTAFIGTSGQWVAARRDMLGQVPEDALKTLSYNSAIISQGALDPDPAQTTLLFKKIIDQVNAGLLSIDLALTSADATLGDILEKIQKKSPVVKPIE